MPILLRARINAIRNSAGRSSGNSAGVFSSSGPSDGVSDAAGVVALGAVSPVFLGCKNCGIFIFGNWIVINGFFVRIIKVVLAT